MTKYDELCQAYTRKTNDEQKLREGNESFARALISGLRDYLGAPATFEMTTENGRIHQSYVTFFEPDNGSSKLQPTSDYGQAIRHSTDGTFEFRFGVLVQRDTQPYNRKYLTFNAVCHRRGLEATVTLDGDQTGYCYSDGETWNDLNDVHKLVYQNLLTNLSRKVGQPV